MHTPFALLVMVNGPTIFIVAHLALRPCLALGLNHKYTGYHTLHACALQAMLQQISRSLSRMCMHVDHMTE